MEGFVKVAQRDDIAAGEMKLVDVDNKQIVLANLRGTLVAFNNECPHEGCDLVEAELDGDEIECDCHGSRFNARTGEVLNPPALEPLTRYAVRLEGDDVLVGPA